MKTKCLMNKTMIRGLIFITAIMWAGCAAKKNIWGDPQKGLILEYRMPNKTKLRYDLSSEFLQGLEVMGQKLDITSNSLNRFSMESIGKENNNHMLSITIDTIYIQVESPRGEMIPDLSGIIGKSFDFVLSPKGKELDYSGAESLKYALGESEKLNMSADFQTLFPNLPENPIMIGESWNSQDTILEKSETGYLQIIANYENVLEGMEHYNGFDCVKIQSVYSGILQGVGSMQGINTITTGTIEGRDTWFFAYKEGLFIKMTSKGQAKTTTEAKSESREIIIPGTRDFAIVTELVK